MAMSAGTKDDGLPFTFQGLKLEHTPQAQQKSQILNNTSQGQGKAKPPASSPLTFTYVVQPLRAYLPSASPEIALIDQQNLQNSRLYQLPLDLLVGVDNKLSGVEPAALRATSRKFLTDLKPTKFSKDICRQFLKLLRKNDFLRACAEEHSGRSCVGHLQPCGACERTHPRCHFSPTQLRAPPETRKCHGTNGVMKVCEHMQFGFHELRALLETSPNGNFFCNAYGTLNERPGVHAQERPTLRLRQNGSSTSRDLPVPAIYSLHISSKQPFSTRTIFAALADMDDLFLCAHIRLSDPRTFTTKLKELAPPDLWSADVSQHDCKVATCHTAFYLSWVRLYTAADRETMWWLPVDATPRWKVSLRVWRFLGMLDRPSCPRWMAFVERNGEE